MSALTRKGSPEKRFIFLVSFAPGPTRARPAELAAKVGTELDQGALARFPLLWHLPAADITGACARMIHDRSEAFGDSVVPMGLTGAPHPLLHIAEIASDIEWSITNLWNTGLTDALHTSAPMIIPRTPDFLRGEALEAYGASEVPVGMLGTADDGLWISIAPTAAGSGAALPVLDAESIGEPGRRTILRALARRQRDAKPVGGARPLVVRFRVTNDDDIERFVATLASAAEAVGKSNWSIAALDLEAAAGPTPDLIASDVPTVVPSLAATTTQLRRRRSSKINTRRILELAAGDSASGDAGDPAIAWTQSPPRAPKRGERDFIASMLGQTSIMGTTMSAHFVGGTLCGVHGAEAKPAKLRPASSYILTADGRRIDEATSSCFSFESEISRGLRSECVIRDPDTGAEARIRTEYSFVGDYDALVATQHTFVDGGGPDDALIVLGVPILERERCAITGRYRDGSTYDFDVSWKLPQVVLAAEVFGIWDGESRYAFVPLTPASHPMLWTATVLDRPEPQIVIGGRYPFGSPAEHHLSFLMIRGDIDDELAERALAGRLPAAISEEVAAGTAAELSIRREPQEA